MNAARSSSKEKATEESNSSSSSESDGDNENDDGSTSSPTLSKNKKGEPLKAELMEPSSTEPESTTQTRQDFPFAKCNIGDNMVMVLKQDFFFKDFYIHLTKTNEKGECKILSMGVARVEELVTIGTSLSEAADRRNNVVSRAPRFELE